MTRITVSAAVLVALAAPAQAQTKESFIRVIVSGHPGDFHDAQRTLPSLSECKSDAIQAAQSAKGRGEMVTALECISLIGDEPTYVFPEYKSLGGDQ
jgi:hypothetical protein